MDSLRKKKNGPVPNKKGMEQETKRIRFPPGIGKKKIFTQHECARPMGWEK
jgi:hypothetical protein